MNATQSIPLILNDLMALIIFLKEPKYGAFRYATTATLWFSIKPIYRTKRLVLTHPGTIFCP